METEQLRNIALPMNTVGRSSCSAPYCVRPHSRAETAIAPTPAAWPLRMPHSPASRLRGRITERAEIGAEDAMRLRAVPPMAC